MESRCPAYNITARKHHVCAQDKPNFQPRELLVHAKFHNSTVHRGKSATEFFFRGKVKFSLSRLFNEIRHQEDMRQYRYTHPLRISFITLSTRWWRVTRFTIRPFYLLGNNHQHLLGRRFYGLQKLYEVFGGGGAGVGIYTGSNMVLSFVA